MRPLTALALLLALAACGQTGPLYLPGEEPPVRTSTAPDTGEESAAGPAESTD